jgi:hypothetical protein
MQFLKANGKNTNISSMLFIVLFNDCGKWKLTFLFVKNNLLYYSKILNAALTFM